MEDKITTILSLTIGILGLVATLVGTYFTYISFVNPITRFKKYLKNPKDWEKFQGTEMHLSIFRLKKYPNFQIVIDWDRPVVENYREEWIRDYPTENIMPLILYGLKQMRCFLKRNCLFRWTEEEYLSHLRAELSKTTS